MLQEFFAEKDTAQTQTERSSNDQEAPYVEPLVDDLEAQVGPEELLVEVARGVRAGQPVDRRGHVRAPVEDDLEDELQADDVRAAGVGCVVTDTIMRNPEVSADLAATAIAAARGEAR